MYVGIDWASQRHAVCVVDDAGHKATAFVIAHTADGFDQLVARLRRYGDPAGLPVAIGHGTHDPVISVDFGRDARGGVVIEVNHL